MTATVTVFREAMPLTMRAQRQALLSEACRMRAQRQCHVFAKFCLAVSSEERLGHRYRYATIVLHQAPVMLECACSVSIFQVFQSL